MRFWILFKSLLQLASSYIALAGEGGALPHYWQVEIDVLVSH